LRFKIGLQVEMGAAVRRSGSAIREISRAAGEIDSPVHS
jgi:hypothetical protein